MQFERYRSWNSERHAADTGPVYHSISSRLKFVRQDSTKLCVISEVEANHQVYATVWLSTSISGWLIHARTHTCTHPHMHAPTHACTHTPGQLPESLCLSVLQQPPLTQGHTHTHTHTHTHIFRWNTVNKHMTLQSTLPNEIGVLLQWQIYTHSTDFIVTLCQCVW